MKENPKIKNIIFDLGGVLLNLDRRASIDAFKLLGMNDAENYVSEFVHNGIFHQLELGLISEKEFYSHLRNIIRLNANDNQ